MGGGRCHRYDAGANRRKSGNLEATGEMGKKGNMYSTKRDKQPIRDIENCSRKVVMLGCAKAKCNKVPLVRFGNGMATRSKGRVGSLMRKWPDAKRDRMRVSCVASDAAAEQRMVDREGAG